MKQIISNYTFSKAAGTVTFTDFSTLNLNRILLITNVTRNTVVYQFNSSSLGGIVSGNVLTLTYDTTSMSDSDKLQIIYDADDGDPVYQPAAPVQQGDLDKELDSVTSHPANDRLDNLSANSLNADLVPATDVSEFRSFSLQVTGTFTASLQYQISNDGTTYVAVGVMTTTAIGTNQVTLGRSSPGIDIGPLPARYFRVRVTSYSSGTINGSVTFHSYTLPTLSTNALAFSLGNVSHDAVDVGGPIKAGLRARTTNEASVSNNDRSDAMGDKVGRQVVSLNQIRECVVHKATTITNSTAETTILTAAGSGLFNDLTALVLSNASATDVTVTIKDATSGTTRMVVTLPALGAGKNTFELTPTVPIVQATANNNWTATLSANTVTVNIYAQGVTNVS